MRQEKVQEQGTTNCSDHLFTSRITGGDSEWVSLGPSALIFVGEVFEGGELNLFIK